MQNTLDKKYTDLLQKILHEGVVKKDRTGTGTKSIFGYQIRHNMKEGFPLLTTKKMAWKSMVVELIWFLRGDTNIKYLVDNGCNIWNGDCYKHYVKEYKKGNAPGVFVDNIQTCATMDEFIIRIKSDEEFAKKFGDLGPIYGKQWRNVKSLIERGMKNRDKWIGKPTQIDQIANLINELRDNPDSRRLLVNAWNVGEIDEMVLPPCHYGFQIYTRVLSYEEKYINYPEVIAANNEKIEHIKTQSYEKAAAARDKEKTLQRKIGNLPDRAISLMWSQRSVDTFLGLPFNIASYGLLLEIIAKEVNMVPDELIGNLGDTHLYLNHLDEAEEQIGRELTYEERYDLWFANNYETGMEKNYEIKPDFDNDYYEPTPLRTREPLPLPKVEINDSWKFSSKSPVFADTIELDMIKLIDYKSHSAIKAALSN